MSDMEIKEFLKANPLINVGRLERSLGIPHGVIRVNSERKIPEKYRELIIESLGNYNPIKSHVVVEKEIVPPMPVKMDSGYVLRKVSKLGIGEHAYVLGKMENGLFKRKDDIADGSMVILKE
jgi:hypothetical protein